MKKNPHMERVAELFLGDWTIAVTNMWWLDDPTTVIRGTAVGEWLGNSFVRLQAEVEGKPAWDYVFGHSDARGEFIALYHDERGVQRVFDLHLGESAWTLSRMDPDFHQRLTCRLEGNRMIGQADASDDNGTSWRKDLDIFFERAL